MESLQNQVTALAGKLDSLYQVIERLDNKFSQTLSECRLGAQQVEDEFWESGTIGNSRLRGEIRVNSELEHKDVLSDGMYLEGASEAGENKITPEIQIQRLTAQLTAAYNRIAALEEQLLLKRIKS
ncbi:MAG: hypothetical protein AAF378_12430 [Cyanobacteria bacterium P01_A01_bin.84]